MMNMAGDTHGNNISKKCTIIVSVRPVSYTHLDVYKRQIKYSKGIEGDISLITVDEFLSEIKKVAEESFRVLKKGKMCAVMIGDVRKYGKIIPLGFRMMECFLQAGFVNKEIIIKEQHNCRSTDYWETQSNNFLLLAHEYIFIFQK